MHRFTTSLLAWHSKHNTRQLPWKGSTNAYHIWLSEIMLQQTQAATVVPYYMKFTTRYTTINALAAAPDDEVFALWQGLGYYSRCKNLLATARTVVLEYGGVFPKEYIAIRALKGVGDYTAAAIGSFAYGLPYAVVDGNVLRILARYFGQYNPVDDTDTLKQLKTQAQQLFPLKQGKAFNQAIMDFGATVCKPKLPLCHSCPLSKHCIAFASGDTALLPVKRKKIKLKHRQFHFLLLQKSNCIYLCKRTAKDIWQNLYALPLVEGTLMGAAYSACVVQVLSSTTQRLTHQAIQSTLYEVQANALHLPAFEGAVKVRLADIAQYSMPKTVLQLLKQQGLVL